MPHASIEKQKRYVLSGRKKAHRHLDAAFGVVHAAFGSADTVFDVTQANALLQVAQTATLDGAGYERWESGKRTSERQSAARGQEAFEMQGAAQHHAGMLHEEAGTSACQRALEPRASVAMYSRTFSVFAKCAKTLPQELRTAVHLDRHGQSRACKQALTVTEIENRFRSPNGV